MDQFNQTRFPATARSARLAAFGVHLLTALGVGLALVALLEAVREHWAAMFTWLGAALIVDGIDGPLARRLDVGRLQPDLSGDTLRAATMTAFGILNWFYMWHRPGKGLSRRDYAALAARFVAGGVAAL